MQPVTVHQIAVGPMANFSYLIEDTATKRGAYVDPGWEVAKVIRIIKTHQITLEKILITHTHFDHIQAVSEAYAALRVPVFVPSLEAEAVQEMGIPTHAILAEDTISVGNSNIQCLHTPGHTPGEICFYIPPHLITGDVLFVDGCGRVDLPGSDPEKMFETLRRLSGLPDETIIYPGHDYGPTATDTLGHQKKTNPYLSAATKGKDLFFRERGVF